MSFTISKTDVWLVPSLADIVTSAGLSTPILAMLLNSPGLFCPDISLTIPGMSFAYTN